jgi:hypothetical protein
VFMGSYILLLYLFNEYWWLTWDTSLVCGGIRWWKTCLHVLETARVSWRWKSTFFGVLLPPFAVESFSSPGSLEFSKCRSLTVIIYVYFVHFLLKIRRDSQHHRAIGVYIKFKKAKKEQKQTKNKQTTKTKTCASIYESIFGCYGQLKSRYCCAGRHILGQCFPHSTSRITKNKIERVLSCHNPYHPRLWPSNQNCSDYTDRNRDSVHHGYVTKRSEVSSTSWLWKHLSLTAAASRMLTNRRMALLVYEYISTWVWRRRCYLLFIQI